MDSSQLNIDHLASRLEPVLGNLLKEGEAFFEQVGSEFSKKASSGLVGTAISAVQSLGKAGWKTIRSSRAHSRFRQRWESASTASERQLAIRQLLAEDPKRAAVLHGLLLRFDFLRAVAEYAEQLPGIGLFDAARRLSEVYVPLRIETLEVAAGSSLSLEARADRENRVLQPTAVELLGTGNHFIEGGPGSGKSTLARWVAISGARSILESKEVAYDRARLPLLISARSLLKAQSDFSSALRLATTSEMSVTTLAELPSDFFTPYAEAGHKFWLIIIDGLDEVEDRRERQGLWDAVSTLHSQTGDAFRFLVFTRPNSVKIGQASHFHRWHVCSTSEADRKLIARRYIDQERKAEEFIEYLATPFADIFHIPLFEAIAASLFKQTSAIPTTQLGLCEAFISALIEKSSVSHLDRPSIFRLLQCLAEHSDFDSSPVEDLRALVPQYTPRVEIKLRLEEIAGKTGLIRFSGNKPSFIHEIFRSYFLASQIAVTHEPTSNVWKAVDPFRLGWTTVQYVCEYWSLAKKEISPAVDALFSFGKDGQACATEVSIACPAVSEKIISKIVDRIFREMYSTGATISDAAALTQLAARRASVKRRLIGEVHGDRDFVGARLECAQCLLGSGHLKEALDALELIAKGENEYHGDRIRAAELLAGNGKQELASEVLVEMAGEADTLGMRADAASILFISLPTKENRELVAELLSEEPQDELDSIDES